MAATLFNRRPKTSHEKKLALISARFREKPTKYPDPFEAKTFRLVHIGQSGVSKFDASGLGGVQKVLLEYYLDFLRKITRSDESLYNYSKQRPASVRNLTIKKGTIIVNYKQHRRPPSDAMLIDQEQTYFDDQIIYCDCFCFEIVIPNGVTTMNRTNEAENCYGYFRQASEVRRTVPESSLFPLDKELSNWFINNRRYPRPPIIACVLGPSRHCTNYYCHVFVTECVEKGLDFVKTVVNYTYGMNENPMMKSTPNLSRLPHLGRPDGPLRSLQRKCSRKPSRSQSPKFMLKSKPSLAPLSGKNGRSMLFTANQGVITSQHKSPLPDNLDEIDRNFHQHFTDNSDEEIDYHESKGSERLDVHGTGPWLAKSTPVVVISPLSQEEFEPLRKRLLDMHIAKEAKEESASRKNARPSKDRVRSQSRDREPIECECEHCEVHNSIRNANEIINTSSKSHYFIKKSGAASDRGKSLYFPARNP